MATTISSATGPLTLTTADNPLYITSTGAVTTTGSGTNAIYGGTAATWTITNAGAVSSSAGDGIVLEDGGSVTNNSTGTIKGDQYGDRLQRRSRLRYKQRKHLLRFRKSFP